MGPIRCVLPSRMDLDGRVDLSLVKSCYKVGFAYSASGVVKWAKCRLVMEENKAIVV